MGNELSLEEVLKVADKVPRWNNIRGYRKQISGNEITLKGYKGYYSDVKVSLTRETESCEALRGTYYFSIVYNIKCAHNGAETGSYAYSKIQGRGDKRISELYRKIAAISKNTASEDIRKRLNL